jgi:hypothetical protein
MKEGSAEDMRPFVSCEESSMSKAGANESRNAIGELLSTFGSLINGTKANKPGYIAHHVRKL